MTTGPDLNEASSADRDGEGEGLDAALGDDVLFGLAGVERRLHARAYHHWVSLLGDAPYPLIDALDPQGIADFAANSVLLDFRGGEDDPTIAYIGGALREECSETPMPMRVTDLPPGSLLSRMIGHYPQLLASKAPAGFEAEFVNSRGRTTLYRAILLPYSSTGQTIDFIHGVVNWKEVADPLLQATLDSALIDAMGIHRPAAKPADGVWTQVEAPASDRIRRDPAALAHVTFESGASPGSLIVMVGRVETDGRIAVLGSVADDPRLADRVLRASQ
ncbi:hypothetical protein [Sphingomonas paucimobilis]|uniref:hypothetical protein n=1 Tax=Sphingomonas paucimobilis TaxID=13689 RepID=UPI0028D7E736|nr:hypothetical protein [Sphingomonas paucimobilis]